MRVTIGWSEVEYLNIQLDSEEKGLEAGRTRKQCNGAHHE